MQIHAPAIVATPSAAAEMDRLGDLIAELSAHLEAAHPPASSTSSASSTPGAAGTPDSAPAPPG